MLFNFGPRSAVLLVFFIHGLIYSGLLLRKGLFFSDLSSKLLSLFIFLCCLYISPWMLGHAGWYANMPYREIMFYIPFQQVFVIGPIIFFYTQSLVNKSFKFSSKDWLHFIPAILYLLYSLVVVVGDKLLLDDIYFYADGRDKDLSLWYQVTGLISMSAYFLASLRYYYHYKKLSLEVLSFADTVRFDWVKRFLIAFLLMQLMRLLFLLLYPGWGSFPIKFWYYLIFATLYYYISIVGYSNSIQAAIPFRLSLFDKEAHLLPSSTPVEQEAISVQEKNKVTAANSEEVTLWKAKIQQLITTEQVYQNPELSLTDLAKQLGTNPRIISKAINQGFQMNFNDFINFHRIEAVKAQLQQGAHQQMTLLGIALDCGFSSKSTFNRAFKKHTSLSPKAYLAQLGG